MAHPIESIHTPISGDFLSQEFSTDEPPLDLSSFVSLEELDVKALRQWNKNGRTHNGIAPIVGTVACYLARIGEHSYYVQHAEPFSDIQAVNHTINKTPAFITKDDSGINEDMTAIAVEAGFNMTIVSQEAGWQTCPSLAYTALNHIAISDKLRSLKLENEYESIPDVNEDEEGVSRGSVLLNEKARMKYVLGRETDNAEIIVPVYHHSNSLVKDLKLYSSLPIKEGIGLAKMLIKQPNLIYTLKDTVVTDPWEIIHALKSIKVLRNAQSHRTIRQLDPNQKGTVTIATNDSFKQTKELIGAYSAFPGMEIRLNDGYHVNFMDPEEMLAYQERTRARAEMKLQGQQAA